MGDFIGLTESAVFKLCKSLRKKRYLKIERVYKDRVVFYNKYTLLK
jgi:DNA-binding MarR family transcriptional regulator